MAEQVGFEPKGVYSTKDIGPQNLGVQVYSKF